MSSRRFRKLELDPGPLAPAEAGSADTDVCRRCGAEQREGDTRCVRCGGVLGGPGQQEFDEAFHARRVAIETGAIDARAAVPTPAARGERDRVDPGFGGVLAAGALTACIFALVSIPVRVAFAAAAHEPMPGRAAFELICVAVLTLVVRWLFAAHLRGL